jgi:hypothetical protein
MTACLALPVVRADEEAPNKAEGPAPSADEVAKLAKMLQNPLAALISVPLQNDFEFNGGPRDDGFRYLLNIQPIIPLSLSEDWNLISRTIVPVISQDDMIGTTSQAGLGDILQSAFLSPTDPGPWGLIWGAGPVFLLPTATDDLLGAEKFGVGPTAVVLRQESGWTYGALLNHVWSVAGDADRQDVSATLIQPFVSYTLKSYTTIKVGTESTYDWKGEQWTVPVNLSVSQMLKIGGQPISISLGGKYYADGPEGTPEWGLRFVVTLLFPK